MNAQLASKRFTPRGRAFLHEAKAAWNVANWPTRRDTLAGLERQHDDKDVGATFIEPTIAEINITSDGFVLARPGGEMGAPHFLGRYADLLRNWLRLVSTAGLTMPEFIEAQALFAAKIGFFGRVTA